jgi:type I restriction enzyme S subunit
MAITGLEAAGTRGSCAITGVEATTNQSCMALFPISGKSITEYLYHFYVYYGNELAFKYCQGTKQQSFTGRIAKKLPINLPPTIEEQKAIAQVLSDTDALIQALEKKIAKKKLIKKGLMQKLLTPKEGWNKKALGDLAIIKKGEQLNRAGLSNNDKYPVINGGVLPSGYTNVYNQEENTITISEGGNSCGYVNRIASKFWQGGHCYSIESDFHYGYLFHFLKSRENEIMALRVGSGLPNIQRNRLLDFIIHFPEPEEQDLIAIILTDLDKEIENLERKLSKYQLAKQGMMQKLLTGKIRLV